MTLKRFFQRSSTQPVEGAKPRARRNVGLRVALVAGTCAIVTGAGVLISGAYHFARPSAEPGDTHPVVSNLHEEGGVYDRPVTSAPSRTEDPAVPAEGAAPALGDVPYRLVIEKIGVDAPVGTFGLDARQIPQVPLNGQEVAWYNFSARPGSGGNAVFAGHVTWNGRGVFYDLDNLAAGDRISVLSENEATSLTYTVKEVYLVDPNDPNAISVMGPADSDVVTLITCGGDPFYVGGTFRYDYTRRLVVRAALNAPAGNGAPSTGG